MCEVPLWWQGKHAANIETMLCHQRALTLQCFFRIAWARRELEAKCAPTPYCLRDRDRETERQRQGDRETERRETERQRQGDRDKETE